MSWGSSQNTKSTQQQQQSGGSSNTTTPNLPAWLQAAFQNNVQGGQNLVAQTQQPIFGQSQTAQFLQQQNQQANNASNNLLSTLASKGIVNSGATSQGLTDIQIGKNANESQFFSQLPFEEQQAEIQNKSNALGVSSALNKAVPYGSTSTGTSSGQSSGQSDQTTTSNPGLAGLVTSVLGAAAGGLTGGMMGGGGLGAASGAGKGGGLQPTNTFSAPPAWQGPTQPTMIDEAPPTGIGGAPSYPGSTFGMNMPNQYLGYGNP